MDIHELLHITPEEVLIAKRNIRYVAGLYQISLSSNELDDAALDVCFRRMVTKHHVSRADILIIIQRIKRHGQLR